MTKYVEITFNSDSLTEGFGFLCMKAAYDHKIRGRMSYGGPYGITIEATGEECNLKQFMEHLKEHIFCSETFQIRFVENHAKNFTEFDIYDLTAITAGFWEHKINQH